MKERSPHRCNLVDSYVDEGSSLKEGGTDHDPMMTPPSYELATKAGKWTSYYFYPCAFK